jgi:hypothetical protein
VFNKVHGNGVPRLFGYWELLQKSVRLVMGSFGPFASGTRAAELLDESVKVRPYIVMMYCFKSLVLPDVSCKDVVVLVL